MAPRPPAHRPPPATTPSSQDLVEELVATVAHELRRPLTALLGALATLQQRGPALPVAQQQELLALARRQGTQLQRLLEQLLVAAALDHSPIGVARPSLVDAAALATEAGMAAQRAHPHHRITIEAAGPLLVWVDPLAISRILGNLLDNAATHAPAGSLIMLIGCRDGSEVVLAVQDQGPGITPDARDRIFQQYTRVDRNAGPAAGGWASACPSPGGWRTPTTAPYG
jgi:two-component system, OmpR family, sensor histidine kinase KdpD